MDKLLECTRAFEKLLDTQYRIMIGRKGKAVEIIIGFSKLDFHHLMGLGKLKDLRIAKQNRETVFNDILRGIVTYKGITESRYMLYKEKVCLSTGEKQIQYDRLTPKR